MVTSDIEFQEIDDITVGQTVIKIPQRTSEDQRQGNLQEAVPDGTSNAIRNDENHSARCKDRKQNGFDRRTDRRKDPEGDARVPDIRYVKEAVYDRCRFVEGEFALN